MLSRKRVLVTGGGGFIGAHLTRRLIAAGAEVCITSTEEKTPWRLLSHVNQFTQRRLRVEDSDACESVINEILPEFVFHLAAQVKGKDISSEMYELVNTEGTKNIFRHANTFGTKVFIALGSRDEYGPHAGTLSEECTETPLDPYGQSKRNMTDFLMSTAVGSMTTTVLRPSSVYGPGQEVRMFIPTCINACLTKAKFNTSPGEHVNDFIYVDDVVDALISTALRSGVAEILNIGSGHSVSFKNVALTIGEMLNDETSIGIGGRAYNEGEFRNTEYSVEKARRLIGWDAKTSLESGLRKTIDWYVMNQKSAVVA